MENTAVLHVMEIIAATFPGQGGGSGGDQPPAFVAGEVARWALRDCILHHHSREPHVMLTPGLRLHVHCVQAGQPVPPLSVEFLLFGGMCSMECCWLSA